MQIYFLKKSIFIVLPLLFLFTACENKKSDNAHIPMENSTQVFSDEDIPHDKMYEGSEPITLNLFNDQNISEKVTISNKKLTFHNLQQSVVLINLFDTLSSTSRSQIIALDTFKEKYKNELFVTSLPTQNDLSQLEINSFKKKEKISHSFLTQTKNRAFLKLLPSSLHLSKDATLAIVVIYKDGNYYSHFEGPVPIEMIQYDIAQAIQKR
ncbi:MAG: Unknown protein [uncultured Sulfurovum sp.]|uniref:Lipoprotein n=1 Tax=uncultured Sulfurovum sp. TaxID=269237 RepID=A0A6S6SXW9_9BACT|nr:MAG: Unknown protein [uncultured Sulfurovum sp.]